MVRKTVARTTGNRFDVFLQPEETARFEALLAPMGAKKGPFTRQLILRALAEDEKARASGLRALAAREVGILTREEAIEAAR